MNLARMLDGERHVYLSVLSLYPTVSMAKSLPTVSDVIEAILDIQLSVNLPVYHWNKSEPNRDELSWPRWEKLSSQPTES